MFSGWQLLTSHSCDPNVVYRNKPSYEEDDWQCVFAAKDIKKVLKGMSKNDKKIKGLILDLRRNPGGLLDQAIKISDFFLDKGTIVSTIGRDKENKKVVAATSANTYANFPIVVPHPCHCPHG